MFDFKEHGLPASIIVSAEKVLLTQKLTELKTHVTLIEVNVGFPDRDKSTLRSLEDVTRVIDDLKKILNLQ